MIQCNASLRHKLTVDLHCFLFALCLSSRLFDIKIIFSCEFFRFPEPCGTLNQQWTLTNKYEINLDLTICIPPIIGCIIAPAAGAWKLAPPVIFFSPWFGFHWWSLKSKRTLALIIVLYTSKRYFKHRKEFVKSRGLVLEVKWKKLEGFFSLYIWTGRNEVRFVKMKPELQMRWSFFFFFFLFCLIGGI